MEIKPGRCLLIARLYERDMTQIELAERLNTSRSAISEYVNNHKIMSLRTAANIALILKCNIQDLYEWETER